MYTENDWWVYLAHHGIKGQRWGNKNGPPYPLSALISTGRRLKDAAIKKARETSGKIKEHRAKVKEEKTAKKEEMARQQAEAEKKSVIASGDFDRVNAYKDKLTTDEYREAVTRVQLTQQLNNNAPRQETKNTIRDATSKLGDVVNFTKKGMEAWNTFATVYNSVSKDEQLPVLEAGWAKKQAEEKKRIADEARKEAEKAFVRNATPDQIAKNASKLSTEALKDASTRATYISNLNKNTSGDSTNSQTKESTKSEPEKPKNTYTRDETNAFWSAAYRKAPNTKMTEEVVKTGADYIKEVMASEEFRKLSARLP